MGSMTWPSILRKYPIVTFNNFLYSRKQLFNVGNSFLCKLWYHYYLYQKGLVTPDHEIAAYTMTNTYVCVSGGKKYSFFGKFGELFFLETPVLRFALLPYYRRFISFTIYTIILHIDRNFESEIFYLANLSDLSLREPARDSFVSGPSTHLRCFQSLELCKVFFTPFNILMTDWFRIVRQFFLVLNAYGAALPVNKPILLSNLCFLP